MRSAYDLMAIRVVLLIGALLVGCASGATAVDCAVCHKRGEGVISIYDPLARSSHASLVCVDCHVDAKAPHSPDLEAVSCQRCHATVVIGHESGAHAKARREGNNAAPGCVDCHGTHTVLSTDNREAATWRGNSAALCGSCHALAPLDGSGHASVPFSMTIHGDALERKGLIVAATCVDCHTPHSATPHTDPGSSVSRAKIAGTCGTCHTKLAAIHATVIQEERWSKAPGCATCHPPHGEKMMVAIGATENRQCLLCHKKTVGEGVTGSAHTTLPCIGCHVGVGLKQEHPATKPEKVACGSCHARFADLYESSAHGMAAGAEIDAAPGCPDCHGSHDISFHGDPSARTVRPRIPALCGGCHGPASIGDGVTPATPYPDYSTSVHGVAAVTQGMPAAAVCVDCHGAHKVVSVIDHGSPVNHESVAATCGQCHLGVYNRYIEGRHDATIADGKERPTCATCHSSHAIGAQGSRGDASAVMTVCADCHQALIATYADTMHGKASTLGYEQAATCADCHDVHKALPTTDPASSVGANHVEQTCGKCHEGVTAGFTEYLTHADYHDRSRYPALYYTWLFMTTLLVSVFGFFGLHTVMWLPRAIAHRRREGRAETVDPTAPQRFITRFTASQRMTHIFVIVSFLLLALTGMSLKFADQGWAVALNAAFGGVAYASLIHRFMAVVTFGYFVFHIAGLILAKRREGVSWLRYIFSPGSMMFNLTDLKEFIATVKWFVGKGIRPDYGRFTYWEKFDYFAVFWGVPVIGFSGLFLWFPEYFSQWLPGWIINVALIIHSDEALLAVGFIFTIHFINTHLRPESFPMDTVIFTGIAPLEKYQAERPREVAELMASGKFHERVSEQGWSGEAEFYVKVIGGFFLACGVALILLIIYSLIGA